ncbi:hypothetical protein SUDANB120_00162 [Streptomyces sp. enrichment culture]|uniref:hypothetical protein n=1 Tax=Streptomyces TaxID=1883 RepID=UPI00167AFB1B|nr:MULTISPECIES: hypothetical protein [Streptomyces]MBD3579316.1 hypothetical protein [Streptomyces sp. KD18]GGT02975.1 hypothetical protein GCM10010286_30240 [Streptomyces toxytricini]
MDHRTPADPDEPGQLSDEEMMRLVNEMLEGVPPEEAEAYLTAVANGEQAPRPAPVDLTPAQAHDLLLFLHRGGG